MRLFQFQHHEGIPNFGDDLNAWLWPRLLPGHFDADDDTLFVGIGTVLNDRLPPARRTLVFGAGIDRHHHPPRARRHLENLPRARAVDRRKARLESYAGDH